MERLTNSIRSPRTEALKELQQNLADLEAAEAEIVAQHERELRLRERYHELFESAPGGYLATDVHGRIREINRIGRILLGLGEGVRGVEKPLAGFVDPVDRADFRRRITRLSRGGTRGDQWECWVHPRGVRRFRALVSAVPAREDGRVESLRWLLQDVTQGYLAQQTVRDLSRRLLRAQDDERRRIAADLHDLSGPILSTLGMLLASTRGERRTPPKVRRTIEEAAHLVDEYAKQVRSISYVLYPPTLDGNGLTETLRLCVAGFRERSGLSVTLNLPPDLGRLPADVERTLYRVVQEALANVLRHSGSRVAIIRLDLTRKAVTLSVEDRGRGMPSPGCARTGGLGLRSIRARVDELGGLLVIRSSPRGTKLTATIPL